MGEENKECPDCGGYNGDHEDDCDEE